MVAIEEFADKDRQLMRHPRAMYAHTPVTGVWFNVDEQAVELTLYADDDTIFCPSPTHLLARRPMALGAI